MVIGYSDNHLIGALSARTTICAEAKGLKGPPPYFYLDD